MYKFTNPHPQGKIVNDCVKRSITITTGRDYNEIKRELNRYKKQTGAATFNEWKRNVEPFIVNELHGVKMSFPAEYGKPRMNGARFCAAYPVGSYLLNMAGHLTACVNGCILDVWDCSEKCVYTAYKIK